MSSSPLFALEVTYGSIMPRKGFSRVLQKDNTPAPLAPAGASAVGSTESYLWYSKDGSAGLVPISNIRIVGREHGDELGLQGYERLPRSLFAVVDKDYRGEDEEELYLCIERDAACAHPLCHLYIEVLSDGGSRPGSEDELDVDGAASTRAERVCIVPGAIYLRLLRAGAAGGCDFNAAELKRRLVVDGDGGEEKDGEEDERLRPHAQDSWALDASELISAMDRLEHAIPASAASSSGAGSVWARGDWLDVFVRRCLSSSFRDSAVLPRVNKFLRLLLSKMSVEMRTVRGEALSCLLDMLASVLGDWKVECVGYGGRGLRSANEAQQLMRYYDLYGVGRSWADRSLSPLDLMLDGYFVPTQRSILSLESITLGLGFALPRQLGGGAGAVVSELLITNLNHFGTCGGWDALLALLEERDEARRITLPQVLRCCTLLHNASHFANSDFGLIYHVHSLRFAHARLLALSAQDYEHLAAATSMDVVDKAVQALDNMLSKGTSVELAFVDESRETFYMRFALQLLMAQHPGMTSRGAKMLGDLAAMTNLRSVSSGSAYASSMLPEPLPNSGTSWLTPRRLLDFLSANGVMAEVLGGAVSDDPIAAIAAAGRLRLDVMRCSPGLLQFAAKGGLIAHNQLAVLWTAASTAQAPCSSIDPAVQRQALALLSQLTPLVPLDLLRMLAVQACFYLSPIANSLQPAHVALLSRILLRGAAELEEADYAPASSSFAPLDCLWEACIVAPDPGGAAAVVEAILAVLRADYSARLTSWCADRFLAALEDSNASLARCNVTTSLLQALVKELPNRLGSSVRQRGICAALDSAACDLQRCNDAPSRLGCLGLRTSLVLALSGHERVSLNLDTLAKLWAAVVNVDDAAVTSALHAWLIDILPIAKCDKTRPRAAPPLIEADTAAALLEELFRAPVDGSLTDGCRFALRRSSVCLATQALLQQLFCLVNEERGLIQPATVGLAVGVAVKSGQLYMLDFLLDVCAGAAECRVQEAGAVFLATLWARLDEGSVDRRIAWTDAARSLLLRLEGHTYGPSGPARVACRGLLMVLAALLREIARPCSRREGGSQHVTVFWGGDKSALPRLAAIASSRAYVFSSSTSIGALRARLARDLRLPASRVELKSADRRVLPLEADGALLRDLEGMSVLDATALTASLLREGQRYSPYAAALEVFEQVGAAEMAPRLFIAGDAPQLALLRDLLCGPDPELAQRSWRVLALLPSEAQLLTQLGDEGREGASERSTFFWVVHLGAGRPGYSLCLMRNLQDALVIERSQEGSVASDWRGAFVRAGGLAYLLGAWRELPLDVVRGGGLHWRCVASLALLVLRVSQAREDGTSLLFSVLDAKGAKSLARHIVDVVLALVQSPAVEDEDDDGDHGDDAEMQSPDADTSVHGDSPPHREVGASAQLLHTSSQLLAALINCWSETAEGLLTSSHAPALVHGLTQATSRTRHALQGCLVRLCKAAGEGRTTLCAGLFEALRPSLCESLGPDCEQLFSLCSHLLKLMDAPAALLEVSRLLPLLGQQVQMSPGERHEDIADVPLRCRLDLLCAALQASRGVSSAVHSSAFLRQVFSERLFSFSAGGGASARQFKADATRDAALRLLQLLCDDREELLHEATGLLAAHHSMQPSPRDDAEGGLASRSLLGTAGIQNPGCVCYICSTLQVLFMMPEVRQAILDIPPAHLAGMAGSNPDVEAIRQLQALFALLQDSERAAVDPRPFCAAFLDFDGRPTSLHDQQDASEFLFNLLQRIETVLMGTRQGSVIQEAVGGELLHELTAEGGLRSERREAFFLLPLYIDKPEISSLPHALAACVEGETVNYSWDVPYDSKPRSLQSSKAMHLQRLPRHLLLHLKRFAFDVKTLSNFKIHKRFEFPLLVDMYPYTVQAAEEKKAGNAPSKRSMYELAGVVVHSGVSTGGHYFAFVKEAGTGKWLEINDGWVGEFDVGRLDEEAFGGESVEAVPRSQAFNVLGTLASVFGIDQEPRPATSNTTRSVAKQRSAFLLVYNRVQDGDETSGNHPFRAALPTPLAATVQRDNHRFFHSKYVLNSPQYVAFAANALERALRAEAVSLASLQTSAAFAFGSLLHCRVQGQRQLREALQPFVVPIFTAMALALANHREGSVWLLSELSTEGGPLKLAVFGLVDSRKEGRAVVSAISAAVRKVFDTSPDEMLAVVQFMEHIYSATMLFEARQHPRATSYFDPLGIVAGVASNHPHLFSSMRTKYLPRALSFFLGHDSPLPELVGGSVKQSESIRPPTSARLLQIISSFLRRDPQEGLSLPNDVQMMLKSPALLHHIVAHTIHASSKALVEPILSAACFDDLESTQHIIDALMTMLRRGGDGTKAMMRVVMCLLAIDDALAIPRTHLVMDRLSATLQEAHRNVSATEIVLDMWLRMAKRWPEVREWIHVHSSQLAWAIPWLQARKAGQVPSGSILTGSAQPPQTSNKNGFGTSSELLKTIELLRDGLDMRASDFWDSDDDEHALVGRRVKVRFSEGRWYQGTVEAVREHCGDVLTTVKYDDGETKDHPAFPLRVWRLMS